MIDDLLIFAILGTVRRLSGKNVLGRFILTLKLHDHTKYHFVENCGIFAVNFKM